MWVVIFNWRAVPLVLGALAAGVASSLLTVAVASDRGAVFVGLATCGVTLLAVDYFSWRRRDLMGMPMWRLIDPAAGGHIFFVPCWVWGGVAILFAAIGLGGRIDEPDDETSLAVAAAIGLGGLLLPPILDFIRPFDRFRWSAREPQMNEPTKPR
jgi:hypothetical protein